MAASDTQPYPELPIRLFRWSIGLCYFWFGMLKGFPQLSPAEDLAYATIRHLSFGMLEKDLALWLLTGWEVGLGLMFLLGWRFRLALRVMMVHMLFTLTPAFLLPDLFFTRFPFGLTLVGQYIIKNLVFMAAALILLWPRPASGRVENPIARPDDPGRVSP